MPGFWELQYAVGWERKTHPIHISGDRKPLEAVKEFEESGRKVISVTYLPTGPAIEPSPEFIPVYDEN